MFDPAYTELYLIGAVGFLLIASNLLTALIIGKMIRDAEQCILAELSYDMEEDLPLWTPEDGPPIDERNFG
jgi:hypothetical protein